MNSHKPLNPWDPVEIDLPQDDEDTNMRASRVKLLILAVLFLLAAAAAKDKRKPWTQWSVEDAKKILNDSGWGQTQTPVANAQYDWAINGVNYRIRFLSAKPIRQAFLRLVQLDPKATPEQTEQAHQSVDAKYEQVVVIAVSYDQDDLALPRDNYYLMPIIQAFSEGMTSTLKNNTYLEIKGGQRVFLQEYRPPSGDGMGAIFIFPRIVNDKPILDPKSGEVRFYAEFPKLGGNDQQIRLNMRFKVSDLMYDGVLEY
jgi:hypothetical protein